MNVQANIPVRLSSAIGLACLYKAQHNSHWRNAIPRLDPQSPSVVPIISPHCSHQEYDRRRAKWKKTEESLFVAQWEIWARASLQIFVLQFGQNWWCGNGDRRWLWHMHLSSPYQISRKILLLTVVCNAFKVGAGVVLMQLKVHCLLHPCHSKEDTCYYKIMRRKF